MKRQENDSPADPSGHPPHELGRTGEKLARTHLEELGYRILEQNLKVGRVEVDLIARDEETLVFVEVKARSTAHFGAPSEAVHPQKQRRILRAARSYLASRPRLDGLDVRFDVISVVHDDLGIQLEHLEDAFEEG